MNPSEISRLQKYLRDKFGCPEINLETTPRQSDSVEMSIGDEFIGVIYKDEEDNEVSYAFEMAILEIDLPIAAEVERS